MTLELPTNVHERGGNGEKIINTRGEAIIPLLQWDLISTKVRLDCDRKYKLPPPAVPHNGEW